MEIELFQDGSEETYVCSPTACGYNGDEHCKNCGYDKGGR